MHFIMNVKIDSFGRVVNPAVQINTSLYSMMQNGIELEDTGDPIFGSDANSESSENVAPFSMFRELDPLYYKTYSPREVYAARELEKAHDKSAMAASNINAVKTD